jgi:hypothetical protein
MAQWPPCQCWPSLMDHQPGATRLRSARRGPYKVATPSLTLAPSSGHITLAIWPPDSAATLLTNQLPRAPILITLSSPPGLLHPTSHILRSRTDVVARLASHLPARWLGPRPHAGEAAPHATRSTTPSATRDRIAPLSHAEASGYDGAAPPHLSSPV